MNSAYLRTNEPLLSTHEELVVACHRLSKKARWGRLLRNPPRAILDCLGTPRPADWQTNFLGYAGAILNCLGTLRPAEWQTNFLAYTGWSREVRDQLRVLPDGFITNYSLEPDTACWLYSVVRKGTFQNILECGCGISTVIVALAIEDRPTRFFSLEHDALWLKHTHRALELLGLSSRVALHHAPLETVHFSDEACQAHSCTALPPVQADLLLIDGPPGIVVGRAGVLPQLAPHVRSGALVILDDARRLGEEKCVQSWVKAQLAILKGYLAKGQGIAVLVRK